MLVDAETFKVDVAPGTELRLYGSRDVDGGFHAELADAVFHDAEFERDDASHFDGAAET